MNYLDDVATHLNSILTAPVFLENWADKEKVSDQVCVMSEPSTVDLNSPMMRVSFGVYSRAKKMETARNNANLIFQTLGNYKGKLDPLSSLVFQHITCQTPPYYYSGEANMPIYLTRFTALVIENSINYNQQSI
jgi:hypothetical protein